MPPPSRVSVAWAGDVPAEWYTHMRRRRLLTSLCFTLLVLWLLMAAFVGGVLFYRHLHRVCLRFFSLSFLRRVFPSKPLTRLTATCRGFFSQRSTVGAGPVLRSTVSPSVWSSGSRSILKRCTSGLKYRSSGPIDRPSLCMTSARWVRWSSVIYEMRTDFFL